MSEYPKRCTMEEAIACVKAGGKARLRGELSSGWTRLRRTKSGDACYRYDDGSLCYSVDFLKCWIYEITKPAPVADQSATRGCSTGEALAEVLWNLNEMVGVRNGTTFELVLDRGGDIECSSDGYRVDYIPVNGITWTKKHVAPKTVTKSFDFDLETDVLETIGDRIWTAARGLSHKVTIECTIKERV